MAITRAQQAKQMLQDGGMLVQPGFGGKRQGYRGDAAYRSASDQSKSIGQGDVSTATEKGEGPSTGAPSRSELEAAAEVRKQIAENIKDPKMKTVTLPSGDTVRTRKTPNKFLSGIYQAGSFLTNPLGFVARKLFKEYQDKKLNEAVGIDYETGLTDGYTGADYGFVVPTIKDSVIPTGGGDDGPQQIIPPTEMIAETPYQEDLMKDENLSAIQQALLERGRARAFAKEGGIMDLEQARQGYKLGKLVKKVTRGLKKIVKSPIGAAAIASFIPFGPKGDKTTLFKKFMDSDLASNVGSFFSDMEGKDKFALAAAAGLTAAPLLLQEDDTEEEYQKFLASRGASGQGFDIPGIRAKPYDTLGRAFVADGGKPEPVAKKTLPLLDMGGKEMDLRDEGGFVPIGRMEKADDVPARLSKNEFVFTADAVRNAGDGNVDKGAEVMYNMMKNLEAGGEVSEESQGLKGARKMFQTSQRLEEVL